MKVKLWLNFLLAYLLWAILLALGFLFGVLAMNALQEFLGSLTRQSNNFYLIKQMIVVDRVFTVLIWLLWLVMMVVSEESFRRGAQSGGLLKRFARFTGPLLIVIFLADLYLLSVIGFSFADAVRWLILTSEIGLGIFLIWYGRPYFQKTQRNTWKNGDDSG